MELKKIRKISLIIIITLVVVDQISKILLSIFLKSDINLISNFLSFTKVENKGIAFGLNKQNIVNIILTIMILFLIIKYIIDQKKRLTKETVIYLSLILAGGISNLIDRIFKGAVFDFIKIGNFPVFNFADCFIVIRMDIICSKFYILF